MSNQVPPGPGQPPYPGAEPPYGPYQPQAPGMPPQGPPPPSEPFPQGAQPSYGQPSYGSEPSYGPPPYGQQPEPSYGPEQPYGAGGYQPGQGQHPPQGGYVPSYAGGPPGAPKGGSGGKIVAIVAAAVVVVGLVVGGVVLLTRDGGDPVADPTTTSASSEPDTPDPDPTTPGRKPTPTFGDLDNDAALELAEVAFPTADGYDFDSCSDWVEEYESDITLSCRDNTSDVHFNIFFFSDQASVKAGILDDWMNFEEVPWEHGTDFVNDGGSYYHSVIRCYSDAPACIEVFEDTKEEADVALAQIVYLDAAGIVSLNAKLDDIGLTNAGI